MPRILLTTPDFPPHSGGIGVLMKNIFEYSSHEITVLTQNTHYKQQNSSDIVYLDMSGPRGLINCLSYIQKHSKEYDGIHFGHPLYSGLGAVLRKEYTVHTHASEIVRSSEGFFEPFTRYLTRKGLMSSKKIISVSEFTKDYAHEITKQRDNISVISPGVEDDYFVSEHKSNKEWLINRHGLQKGSSILLTVSRLDPRKGHELVIKCLKNVNAEYLVCGDGDGEYKSSLMQLANELGVQERVHFVGYVQEELLPRYYNGSDIYIMPSRHIQETGNVEGFGISFLEANAAGTPTIGTKTGGIPSAILDGKSGLLVDPNPDAVEQAILEIIANWERDDPREWAFEHIWKTQINKIDDIFEQNFG